MKLITTIVATLLLGISIALTSAAELKLRKPGSGDKCPVCGMFVAKFPDFAAQVQFKDGSTAHFDGTRDLFAYYQSISRYAPGKSLANVTAVFVTSYYTLAPINGLTAWYVAGSDVYGPMGRELIPFARESEAQEFKKDHKGTSILRFKEVTQAIVKGLD